LPYDRLGFGWSLDAKLLGLLGLLLRDRIDTRRLRGGRRGEQQHNDQKDQRLHASSFHFVLVYAIRNPCRSALRCEELPGAATIIAKSHLLDAAVCNLVLSSAFCAPRRRPRGIVLAPANSAVPSCM